MPRPFTSGIRAFAAIAVGAAGPCETIADTRGAHGDSLAAYHGSYAIGERDFIDIMPSEGSQDRLFYLDSQNDRGGLLVPVSPDSFVGGPHLGAEQPVVTRAQFLRAPDGHVVALRWQLQSGEPRVAPRVAVRGLEVAFESGDATIAGTLTMPCTPGRHPVVVVIQGAGPSTRDGAGPGDNLASLGMARLAYDKRGAGRSTGRYHDFLTIDQLATDALAGITYLRSRSDIDSTRIGLMATSQGGWVAALVAARTSIQAIVLVASSLLTVAENGLFEIDNNLRIAGFSEADVARAHAVNELFVRMILGRGAGWKELRAALQTVRREAWFPQAGLPDSLPPEPGAANLRWVDLLRGYLEFDPMPLWRRSRVPVLACFGGYDRNVDGKENARLLRQAAREAGNQAVVVEYVPNADHWQWIVPGIRPYDARAARVRGQSRIIHAWLARHLGVAPGNRCLENVSRARVH